MFGPPFGGMGGFDMGVIEVDELGFPMMPRHGPPMGGMPVPFLEIREPDPRLAGMRPSFEGAMPMRGQMRPLPVGMAGMMRQPPAVGTGMPQMMGQPPRVGMQEHFGSHGRQHMPNRDVPGIGRAFDPSRAQRNQGGREKADPSRRHCGHDQPPAKYEKVKSLTPGGMSKSITIIRSRDDGKLYVEKQVRTDGPHAKRTKAEVKALKAVKGHANLNKMIEYEVKANGICSIILEYCDGGALDKRIADIASRPGHFDEAGVWHILLSVSKALAFLHTGIKDIELDQPNPTWNTICHLDLKPQNIFISSEGRENGQRRVVLADFGCAVTLSDIENQREDHRGQPCGTPGWYPPEGIAKQGYGTKTDMWMLGGTIQVICLLMAVPHRMALASSQPCGHRYSSALQDMVKELTKDRFDKRPSARRVAAAAGQGLQANMRR